MNPVPVYRPEAGAWGSPARPHPGPGEGRGPNLGIKPGESDIRKTIRPVGRGLGSALQAEKRSFAGQIRGPAKGQDAGF